MPADTGYGVGMIEDGHHLSAGVYLRPAVVSDAEALSHAYERNYGHLAPFEPSRGEEFYTVQGQAERLRDQLKQRDAGQRADWVLAEEERVVGTVSVSNIIRGPLQSANLGYWVDAGHNGKGLATAAVRAVCRLADTELGLHRLEAGTVPENTSSQRVLEKCGFELIGTARGLLHIAGSWRDHRMYQRILNDRPPEH